MVSLVVALREARERLEWVRMYSGDVLTPEHQNVKTSGWRLVVRVLDSLVG